MTAVTEIAPDLAADPVWGPAVQAADAIARDQVRQHADRYEWRRTRVEGEDGVELTVSKDGHAGRFAVPLAKLGHPHSVRFLARMAWGNLSTSITDESFARILSILRDMYEDAEAQERSQAGALSG